MTAIALPLKARTPAPAAKPEPTAPVWNSVDPASLPEDLAKLYYAYQQAQAIATEARRLFESETNEAFDSGPGNRLAFGYKFDKLSVAIVKDAPRTSTSAKSLTAIARLR